MMVGFINYWKNKCIAIGVIFLSLVKFFLQLENYPDTLYLCMFKTENGYYVHVTVFNFLYLNIWKHLLMNLYIINMCINV